MIKTTTSTTSQRPTTTFMLPTPVYLTDIRYQFTADHYWCFLSSCVNSANTDCSYIASAKLNSTGDVTSQTMATVSCIVNDSGKIGTAATLALASFGANPTYINLPIMTTNWMNVTFVNDQVAGGVANFSAASKSCITVATYSQFTTAKNQQCMFDASLCYYGISVAVWVQFSESTLYSNNPKKMVIIGMADSGFSFYQTGITTGVTVNYGTTQWLYEIQDPQVLPDTWVNLGFRWNQNSGISIYVNNVEYKTEKFSQISTVSLNFAMSEQMNIGCMVYSDSPLDTNYHADMLLAHIAIWMWNLRDSERVYLSGGLNYKFVPATTTSTEVTTPYKNLNVLDLDSGVRPYTPSCATYNPVYQQADFYSPLDSTASTAIFSGTTIKSAASNPQMNVVHLLNYLAFVKFSMAKSSCMTSQLIKAFCSNGLSVGIMLNISSSAYQNVQGLSSPFILIWQYKHFAMFWQNNLLVVEFSDGQQAIVQYPIRYLNNFVSIGFSWYPAASYGRTLAVYFNGVAQSTIDVDMRLNVASYQNTTQVQLYLDGDLRIGSVTGSLPNVEARDLAIWERYLFPFEAGRFLGLTPDQFAMFIAPSSSIWWTTDYQAYCTMKLLSTGDGIYVVNGITYQFVPDRNNKSLAFNLTYQSDTYNPPWLLLATGYPPVSSTLGLFPQSNCIVNPGYQRCLAGLSAAIWIIVNDESTDITEIFYSTGDSSTMMYATDPNGFGIDGWTGFTFLQNGAYIGVSLSTANMRWEMYMDQTLFTVGQWVNLGFTWSLANGLRLFINGQYTGLSLQSGITYPRDANAALYHGRTTVGRYSSDLLYFYSNPESYNFGNFAFSDLFIIPQEINTEDFGPLIGLSSNQFYSTADAYYDSQALITGSVKLLQESKSLCSSIAYGPIGNVGYSVGVDLTGPGSGLSLGCVDSSYCLYNTSRCADSGLSVSMWVRFSSRFAPLNSSNASEVYIFRTTYAWLPSEGISIVAQSGNLTITVQSQNFAINATFPLASIKINRYVNLAITWHPLTASILNVYLNGTEIKPTITKSSTSVALSAVQFTMMTIGSSATDSPQPNTDFSVYNLAYWSYLLTDSQINLLCGITAVKSQYIGSSDLFWTFSGEYKKLQPFIPQLYSGAQYAWDRFGYGLAAQVSSVSQSYVLLATAAQLLSANSCLAQPSTCIGLFFQFWATLSSGNGFLFTNGAENTSYQGISVRQSTFATAYTVNKTDSNGTVSVKSAVQLSTFLIVTVRAGNFEYLTSFNVTDGIGTWTSYAVLWNSTGLISLYMGNAVRTSNFSYSTPKVVQSTNATGDFIMGKSLVNSSQSIDGTFDDILAVDIKPDSPFDINFFVQQLFCYENAYAVYSFNRLLALVKSSNFSLVSNHQGFVQQAIYLRDDKPILLESILGCSSSPAMCSLGISASVWAQVASLRSPTYFGEVLGVLLASCTPWNSTGFAIYFTSVSTVTPATAVNLRFELNDGNNYWMIDYKVKVSSFLKSWVNYGISWSPNVGLLAFINGTAVMQQLQKVSPPPNGRTNATGGGLVLGKFSTADSSTYLDTAFDSAAYWQIPFTTSGAAVPRIITGNCNAPLGVVATAVPTAPPVVTLPPNFRCSSQIDGVCTDGSISNLQLLSNANFIVPITYAVANALIPNLAELTNNVILLRKAGPGMTTTIGPDGQAQAVPLASSFLTNCAQVLSKIASNLQQSDSQTSASDVSNSLSSFVTTVDNLLSPAATSAWLTAGRNWTATLLQSVELFALASAKQIPFNSSSPCYTASYPMSQLATHIAVISSSINCSDALAFPPAGPLLSTSSAAPLSDSIQFTSRGLLSMNKSFYVVSSLFQNIESILPTDSSRQSFVSAMNNTLMVPNSRIISMATYPESTLTSSEPIIQVTLQLLQPNPDNLRGFVCAFWNFSASPYSTSSKKKSSNASSVGAWDTTGCYASSANSTTVTCMCNHMTNFAILMQPVPAAVPDVWKLTIFCVNMIGLSSSILALIWLLFCLIKFKSDLRNDDRCLIHVNFFGCFLVSDVLLLTAANASSDCQVIATLIQFALTATFEWLYFEELHLHFAVTAGELQGRFWKCYVPLGWLIPLVSTVVCQLAFPSAYGYWAQCWIKPGSVPFIVFNASSMLFCLLALITGCIVICNLRSSKCREQLTEEFGRSAKRNVICCTLLVLGWLSGALAAEPVAIPLQLVYALVFTFNGVWIFLLFGLASQELRSYVLVHSANKNKVIDSSVNSRASSVVDLNATYDKNHLISQRRSSGLAGDHFEDENYFVPRVSYVPDADLSVKKPSIVQENEEVQSNGRQSVSADMNDVDPLARVIPRRLLPMKSTKPHAIRSFPSYLDNEKAHRQGDASNEADEVKFDTETTELSNNKALPPMIKPKKRKKKAAPVKITSNSGGDDQNSVDIQAIPSFIKPKKKVTISPAPATAAAATADDNPETPPATLFVKPKKKRPILSKKSEIDG